MKVIFGVIFRTIICGVIAIVLNSIIIRQTIKFENVDSLTNLINALLIISFVLAAVNYLISSIYKRALWRCIPCCNRNGSP